MVEEKNGLLDYVGYLIVSLILTIILGGLLQITFSPETEFMKRFIWIAVGVLFVVFCVMYTVETMREVFDKASKTKETQNYIENSNGLGPEKIERTPEEQIKYMLEEQSDKSEALMTNKAKETFSDFDSKFTIDSGGSRVARKPREIMLTNEEMFAHLQKQADLLETIDIQLMNNMRNKALTLSKEINKDSALLESFRQELKGKGIPLKSFGNIAEKARKFIEMLKEADDYTSQRLGIIRAGVVGEQRIEQAMSRTNHLFDYFMNVRLEYNNQSIETDCLVVCNKGIFLIEGKNYGEHSNYGLHITSDGQWRKTFNDGSSVALRKDFIAQVNRQMFGVQKLIMEQLNEHGQNIKPEQLHSVFHPLIAMANDSIEIVNDTTFPIIRPSLIYHYIMDHPDVLTKDQVEEVIEIIKKHTLPPLKFSTMDYIGSIEDHHKSLLNLNVFVDYIHNRYESYSKEVEYELLDSAKVFN